MLIKYGMVVISLCYTGNHSFLYSFRSSVDDSSNTNNNQQLLIIDAKDPRNFLKNKNASSNVHEL